MPRIRISDYELFIIHLAPSAASIGKLSWAFYSPVWRFDLQGNTRESRAFFVWFEIWEMGVRAWVILLLCDVLYMLAKVDRGSAGWMVYVNTFLRLGLVTGSRFYSSIKIIKACRLSFLHQSLWSRDSSDILLSFHHHHNHQQQHHGRFY